VKYSIIICTYNWPTALDLILAQFVTQIKHHSDVEIVIADDGSKLDTKEIVSKYQTLIPNLIHVWHEDIGFRRSMILNKAVAKSNGDYLFFLDGDCIPFPDYINQQKKLVEEGYFVAGNRVLLSENFTNSIFNDEHVLNKLFNWNILQWLRAKYTKKVNKFLGALRLNSTWWRYFRSTNWKYPKGCNFAVSRKDFIQVNGFDEDFIGWGFEDSDLFVRLLHSGIKIKNGKFAITVIHLWHKVGAKTVSENSKKFYSRLNDTNFIKVNNGINNWL
jgi:glycosyltransferase involved in cell wall biosynthesis